jgi:MarR family transcriptional repressor of emrRAB
MRDDRLVNLLGVVAIGLADASVGDVAEAAGIDTTAAAALVAMLDLTKSGSVRRLSQLIGISHSGTVRLVNRLAELDLLERKPGTDNRSVSVTLTRRGGTLARRLRSQRHAAIAAALTGLTPQQLEQLGAICELVIANLTAARLDQRDAGRPPSGGALCRMCDPGACGRPSGRCPAARAAATFVL